VAFAVIGQGGPRQRHPDPVATAKIAINAGARDQFRVIRQLQPQPLMMPMKLAPAHHSRPAAFFKADGQRFGADHQVDASRLGMKELDLAKAAGRGHAVGFSRQEVGVADELRHAGVDRAIVDHMRRRYLNEFALKDNRNFIRQCQRFFLVVGDEDGGGARFEQDMADFAAHLRAQTGVEVGKRLVQQQDVRIRRQRPGQRHTLLLPA